jgi:2-polyprenyl-3-methyl-5-hydroxy-6-metoxy-1,4-benzoquinol methylase
MPRSTDSGPVFPCRLCGSLRLRLFYTQGNEDQYLFYRCVDCRLVNYDLAGGLNQEKYADTRISPGDNAHPGNRGATLTFQAVRQLLPPPARLLDLGCGNGRLLYLAHEAGYEVQGLELSSSLAAWTQAELGIEIVAGDFLSCDLGGRHDIVILRHVLEHLPDPRKAAARLHGLLLEGGHAVLEFPNIDGLGPAWKRWLRRTGLHRRRYPVEYVPGHCHEYARDSFEALLARGGFRLISWRTYSLHPVVDAFYGVFPVGDKVRAIVRRA